MPPPPGQHRSEDDSFQRLFAGQAATEQRFIELFRRLDKAESTAAEARDIAKEIATILREQNALERIAEVKAEGHALIAALRQDLVLAVNNLRKTVDPLVEDVETMKTARASNAGMAKGARLAFEAAKLMVAAGGGAILIRLMGVH